MNSPNNNISFSFLSKKNIVVYIILLVWNFSGWTQKIDPDGYNVFYYDNGEIASEGYFKKGKPEGIWKSYHPGKILKSVGNKKNGLSDSLWTFYDEKGRKKWEYDYWNDKKNGCATLYDSVGNVIEERFYEDNILQDEVVAFYSTGELRKKISYEDGKEVGVAHEFSKEGRVITEEVYDNGFLKNKEEYNRYDKDGRKTGIWREYFPDGSIKSEGVYKEGEKNGVFKEYNKKGKLVDIKKMKDDTTSMNPEDIVLIKLYKEYYRDGKVKLIGGYSNGMKSGIFREYSQAGELINGYLYEKDTMVAEGIVRFDGNYEGEWKHYYKSGELKASGIYEDGVKSGKWTYYYKNGKKEQEGKFKENQLYGEWIWYYASGQRRRTEYYNRKEKLEGTVTEWDSLGNEISRGDYYNGLREGSWFYHVGDYKEVGEYTIGLQNGNWRYFYKSGKLAFSGNFNEGEPKGKHIYYHENGIKKQVGKYLGGEKNGVWRTYNQRGEEIETIHYKRGEIFKINGFRVEPFEDE
ncbi:MAG: hypothetical protein MI810_15270 [Flavobacteriales bacterium]|nr:hypothetical protein [Flavobacteriales bacterium]